MPQFRNLIPSEHFPAEKGRYVLYINHSCPWCHRNVITHALKGIGAIVQLIEVDARHARYGWYFSGPCDPCTGVRWLKELYLKADPQYNGRITVPLLWDRKHGTIVNNESSEIMRMFITAFDQFLPSERREVSKGIASFIPTRLRAEIDTLNAWVYDTVNNGVYKVGFASSQATYDEHVARVFEGLDCLEYHLSQPVHYPYLFGNYITEADIRLYPTLIRFDAVYYTVFKCNLKMIRSDYPRLHAWLRRLYWSKGPETSGGVFKSTTFFNLIKSGYASVAGDGIIPVGPHPNIMPL